MTKLEQVARALAIEDDEEFGSNAWEAYLPMARAAVEAMKEVTPEIQWAIFKLFEPEGTNRRRINTGVWYEGHYTMISAALSEKPE
jgi:hypothetical protein